MSEPQKPPANPGKSLILGGILPVVLYTVVEEYFGTLWGLVAGMLMGGWEIISEWRTQRRVETITWIGNGLLFVMGGVSLFTNSGIWFKLQPAILEFFMAVVLVGSCVIGKPFMAMMMEKQQQLRNVHPAIKPIMKGWMNGLTLRLGIFFLLHAILAAYAAAYWSTRAWAILKGIGFTGSMFLYMGLEAFAMRRKMMTYRPPPPPTPDSQNIVS